MYIQILETTDPGRIEAEILIHKRYREIYNADVHHYMPHLMQVFAEDGTTVAVVGYRNAARHTLFLERYLDGPVEEMLSTILDKQILRNEVVEVGNLGDIHPGGARTAIMAMTNYLHQAGFRWVVFTGVPRLYNAFQRLGLKPVRLNAVDPGRLSEQERQEWGDYYDASPCIMMGDIGEGYASLDFDRQVLNISWDKVGHGIMNIATSLLTWERILSHIDSIKAHYDRKGGSFGMLHLEFAQGDSAVGRDIGQNLRDAVRKHEIIGTGSHPLDFYFILLETNSQTMPAAISRLCLDSGAPESTMSVRSAIYTAGSGNMDMLLKAL